MDRRKSPAERPALVEYDQPGFFKRTEKRAGRTLANAALLFVVVAAVPAALLIPTDLWLSAALVFLAGVLPAAVVIYLLDPRGVLAAEHVLLWNYQMDRAAWFAFDGGPRPWTGADVDARLSDDRSDAAIALRAGWHVRNADQTGIRDTLSVWAPTTEVPLADRARMQAVADWLADSDTPGEAALAAAEAISDADLRRQRLARLQVERARWAASDDAKSMQGLLDARATIGGYLNEFQTDADRPPRYRRIVGVAGLVAWACLFLGAARIAAL